MRDEYPVLHMHADAHKNVPLHTQVINKNSVPYTMVVELPEHTGHSLRFVGLYEETNDGLNEVALPYIKLHCCHPYIDILSNGLNTEVGQHDYQIKFIHPFTEDIVPLYFSYIIQDDNPEKSYIYMDELRQCEEA